MAGEVFDGATEHEALVALLVLLHPQQTTAELLLGHRDEEALDERLGGRVAQRRVRPDRLCRFAKGELHLFELGPPVRDVLAALEHVHGSRAAVGSAVEPFVDVGGRIRGRWIYVGVKAKTRVQQRLAVGRHRSTQLFKDVLRNLGRKRAEAVLLAAQEHVAVALALALAALELGHADLRGLVCVACLFPDAPVHACRARTHTIHSTHMQYTQSRYLRAQLVAHLLPVHVLDVQVTSAKQQQHHLTTQQNDTTESHQRISARRNSKPYLRA